jgi:hypothetical protein
MQFPPKDGFVERHEDQQAKVLFERLDEPFHHGDTAMLMDGAIARLDLALVAPALKAFAPELFALVADQMPGLGLRRTTRVIEEQLHGFRRGFMGEAGSSHDPP